MPGTLLRPTEFKRVFSEGFKHDWVSVLEIIDKVNLDIRASASCKA
jgi:hypothetical protein